MLKIIHLDTGIELRGGQQQLLFLARGLRQRGHEQLIVCPETSALEARARREGFRVFALPAHDPARAFGTLLLRQHLLTESFDILHAHDGRGQTIAWLASLGMPMRRVASRRVTFLPRGLAARHFRHGGAWHAIIAVSKFVRHLLITSGVPQSKIEVIPDGIEVPTELPSAELRLKNRAGWGAGPQDFLVGHAGAFTREKGQDLAAEAALLLASDFPRLRMLLAGDGPLRSSREIQAKVRQAQGRVQLIGYLEDLTGLMQSLDLFIMPSRAEGLGSSALMAMAHGLAVVATRVGGLPEIVEDGKTGWLVAPDSAAALAEAILTAPGDRRRLAELGSKARERAREFSVDIMVERTESLYRRLAGSRVGTPTEAAGSRGHHKP